MAVLCILFLTSCASAGRTDNDKSSSDSLAPEPLFSDWQYRGFGNDYPYWCESVLKEEDVSALAAFFPEIDGHEKDVNITVSYGMNLDMCTLADHGEVLEISNLSAKLIAKSWVMINPVYEDFSYPYIYIRLYLKTSQEESL